MQNVVLTTNMATVGNLEIVSEKANVVGTCTCVNYTNILITDLYKNLLFLLPSIYRQKHMEEGRGRKFSEIFVK
jgi:hypothetical protein